MKTDEILHAALGKNTAAERDAFLEGACGDDAALRASVESLLKAHEAAGSFLEKPLFESASPQKPPAVRGEAPRNEGSVLSRLDPSGRLRPRMLLRDTNGDKSPVLLPGGGRTEGRYRLVGEIARGGVGVVHKGQDIDLGRDVALKVLREEYAKNPEMLQRFVEEAQIGGQLQHPGIVPVYELGLGKDGQPFFTMKLVKGRTLALLLTERKDPSQERRRFLGIFEAVCQTIAYAHARGVIHRDLKPSNVMVGAFGEVLVVDWGMGKVLAEGGVVDERRARDKSIVATVRSASVGSHSVAGSVMGTPAYMPPEQARGEVEHLDERSDVFSLGAILCEILSGHPPYVGDSRGQLAQAAQADLEDAWRRLDKCGADSELIQLAKECLAPDPLSRPKDAGAVAGNVTAYLASVEERARQAQIEALEATLKAAEERRRRKLSWALAASVVLTLVLGGAGAYWAQETKRTRRAETAGAVAQALDDATLLRGKAAAGTDLAPWKEAVSAAKRAEAISCSRDADEATRRKASRLLADLEAEERAAEERADRASRDAALVERLDEIRQSRGEHWDKPRAVQETADALREHGIDPDGDEDLSALAQRIRSSPIAIDLLTALDEWRLMADRTEPTDRLTRLLDEADPDSWRARLRAAETVEDFRDLARGADVETMPVYSLRILANRLGKAGDVEGALALARRLQARHPDDFWANWVAARWSDECTPKRLDDAVRYLTAAIALRPQSFAAYTNLGNALDGKGELDGALAAYREALDLRPDDATAHNNLGIALDKNGDPDGAVAEYREAIRLEPDFAEPHINLGRALLDKGDAAGAVAACREATLLEPDNAHACVGLGNAFFARGDLEDAEASYREAIRLEPDFAGAHLSLGNVLHARGGLEGAEASYREAIRLKSDFAGAHLSLGVVLRAKGDLDGAVGAYREAILLRPDHWGSYNKLGNALARMDDLEGAVAAFRNAIDLDPGIAGVHCNLGNALLRQGDLEKAESSYREAIRLKPDYAEAHCYLGSALRSMERHAESLEAYRKGHELGSAREGWSYPSADWVREAERLADAASQVK